MYEDLASIRETVDLSAREVLDDALTFLTRQGYITIERTDTSLTATRRDRNGADDSDQPHLTVLTLPRPEGGVQVRIRGNDRDGMRERQSEWSDWANNLPKRAPDQEITRVIKQEQSHGPLPAPLPASKPAVAPHETVEAPKTKPSSAHVIFDRPDQLEKIRAGLLPGEEIEAVFDLKGGVAGSWASPRSV